MSDEDDYFRKLDQEAKAKLKSRLDADQAAEEREARRVLHRGFCGKCGGRTAPHIFRGVEIDVCEDCSAVLLDPGELNTLAGKDGGADTFSSFFSMFGGRKS